MSIKKTPAADDDPATEATAILTEKDANGSTGILLSTLWNQSGVISIGDNRTVTYNEYTPLDPTDSKHCVTGCTNTAAAQLIYYFIEQGQLDLSLTLTADDAYTSKYDGVTIAVKADGSTPGTISFAAVNNYLENYSVTSAECAAALLYACGVVQRAGYTSSATGTGWNNDLFYRSGFQSVGRFGESGKSKTTRWGDTDAEGHFTISDAGFEVLIENLRAGRPVGTTYPGHALVIDGYDAENDLFHINFGWGRASATSWYTRAEMREKGYHDFIYDLCTEFVETFSVTDSRAYGTGTMVRAFEQAASFKGSNTVVFSASVKGRALVLDEYIVVKDSTTIRDFNMTLTVNDLNHLSWNVGFYAGSTGDTVFEKFGGTAIANSKKTTNAVMDFTQGDSLTFSGGNALLYAGSYAVNDDYSAGAAKVLSALRTAREKGTAVDDFITAAAVNGFCFYCTQGGDSITLADRSLAVGKNDLRAGNDALTVTGNSRLYGNVFLGAGDDALTVAGNSQVTGLVYGGDGKDQITISGGSRIDGDIYLEKGNDTLTVTGGSRLYGNISGSDKNTITVDSSSTIAGGLYAKSNINFVLDSAAATGAIYLVRDNVYNVCYYAAVSVDITDAEVGSYVLFAADEGATNASQLNQLAVTVTAAGMADYTLVGNGSTTGTCADLVFESGALKLEVKIAPAELVPRVVSVSADITGLTNKSVTVTAVFSKYVASTQYSTDNKTWKTYSASGVVMGANGTVYFRCISADGTVSEVASYKVTNIDKKAPAKPVATADITTPTNGNVTVTAVFSSDSVQKQYLKGATWLDYTTGVVMSANGTVYFRGIDAAGNVSELTRYTVSNIDKVAPVRPTASADVTTETEGVVTVTASFSGDSAQKQYSFDNATWQDYTDGVVMRRNGFVYFRGIDAVGNISAVASYEVTNIISAPVKTVAGDLNGDGRADIVMTIADATHPADGSTGAWLTQSDQTAAWGDLSQRGSGWEIFGTGVTTVGKATNDVYVKSTGNVVGAWVTDDTGNVTGWATVGTFDATTQVLGLGDFNGDGQTDLLLRNTNGAVGCCFTGGDVTGWNYFQSLGDEWSICAVGDLNGDGRDDVVLKHDAGFAGSWLTQSDYTMAWANLDTLPDGFAIVGAGDFDGDGTSDVLIRNGSYYGAWLVENGSVNGWMGLGDLGSATVEQIADFDGDDIADLRIRTASGDLGAQLVKGADNLTWKYYGSVGSEWSTSLAAI